jgi:hypothetical protein
MRAARGVVVSLLALAVLAGSAAPTFFVQSLIPCMDPSDCAAMRDLCDMTGMTSHDSCCNAGTADDLASLPATFKSPASHTQGIFVNGLVATLAQPAVSEGSLPAPHGATPHRSSPSTVSILRI